jgi:hypothetical protein
VVPARLIAAAREAELWLFAMTEVPQGGHELEISLQRVQEFERQLKSDLHAYRISVTTDDLQCATN